MQRIPGGGASGHAGDLWDADETYFVFDEMKCFFPQMQFEPLSPCAGILSLRRHA